MTAPPVPPWERDPPPRPPASRQAPLRGYGVEAGVGFLVLVLAAAVVIPTWLLGGFQRVELPVIRANETVAYGEVAVTPLRASLQPDNPVGGKTRKGHDYLVVRFRAVNRLDERLLNVHQLVVVGTPVFAEPTKPQAVTLAGETSDSTNILPRLPRNLRLIWEVPGAVTVPDELRLTLRKRSKEEDFFGEKYRWKNPEPWVRARLRVQQP